MSIIIQSKVVSSLPGTLTASTLYYVRVGTGFDLYLTNDTGTLVAYKLNTPAITARNITATGDGSWSVNFDDSADVTSAFTLASSGVSAGTYGTVTVNSKGLATGGSVATPVVNGGTGSTNPADAAVALQVVPTSALGVTVATLVSGTIPASQLPSYVDDVLEVSTFTSLPATGESGKIYVILDTNLEYRWSGSTYIKLVSSPGTTDALAQGTTNLYFTVAQVLASALDTLTLTNSAVIVGDSVRVMFGKLQAQVSAREPSITTGASTTYWNGLKVFTDFATTVRSSVMTGVVFTTTTAMLATDTLLVALGKLQGQVTLRALSGSNADITAMSALASVTATKLTVKAISSVNAVDKVVVNAAATGTVTLNCSLGCIFDLTLTGNTTLVFSNAPTLSSENFAVVVKVRQGATAYTLTMPSGVTYVTSGGSAIATPGASKRQDYVFSTTTGTAWDVYAGGSTT